MVVKTTIERVRVLELKEKAVSIKQQRFFGMVRAAQKGEMKNPSSEVKKVAGEISKKDAKDFAKTKHKGLPQKKKIAEHNDGSSKNCKKDEYFCKDDHKCKPIPKGHHVMPNGDLMKDSDHKDVKEGSLHKWFKGSKSKDGKGGWVNVKTGGTCASDEPGEGTPKCVSSSKRASMTKAERDSASRRKKAADPNQQSKSGAAKPTYVATDKKKKVNEALSVKDTKKLNKASALDQSNDPKDQDRARARRTEVDYKDLLRQINKRKKPMKPALESFEIDKSAHKAAQKKSKMRNLAKGNTNPNEKAAAEKKAGGPKLYGEACWKGYKAYGMKKKGGKMVPNCKPVGSAKTVKEGKTFDSWKKAAASALGRKKEEKKPQKATDAGARAKRMLQRKVHAKYVSGSTENVPDEMRD